MTEKKYYCTLFDSAYLDKGLVTYYTLHECAPNAELFILAMDEKCESILKDINEEKIHVISTNEFENETLKRLKVERTHKEYCWTCLSVFTDFVLDKYNMDVLTYIDADMQFYRDPGELVDDILNNGCSIGLIKHGFPDNIEGRYSRERSGTYCVSFNTFVNDERGRDALRYWRDCCIRECKGYSDGKQFADQMYLEDWTSRFDGVYEHKKAGAGMALWNIVNFKWDNKKNKVVLRKNQEDVDLYFYHFHGIDYINDHQISTNAFSMIGRHDSKLIYDLYSDYMHRIIVVRKMLNDRYGLEFQLKNARTEDNGQKNSRIKMLLGKWGIYYIIKHWFNRIGKEKSILNLEDCK